MKYHDSVFYAIVFFLAGVLLASAHLNFVIILLLSFWAAAIFLFLYFHSGLNSRLLWLAGLSVFIIVGSGYFLFDDLRFRNFSLPIGEETDFTGLIINDPEASSKSQRLIVEAQEPYRGRVLIRLNSRPAFHYGDLVGVTGTIKLPDGDRQKNFFAKEKIAVTIVFPQKIAIIEANR